MVTRRDNPRVRKVKRLNGMLGYPVLVRFGRQEISYGDLRIDSLNGNDVFYVGRVQIALKNIGSMGPDFVNLRNYNTNGEGQ